MKRKINIFLLTDCFGSLQGGAERQIFEFIKNADKDKYKIVAGCLSPHNKVLNDIVRFGVHTLDFNIRRIYDPRGIFQGFKFAKFLKNEKIDVLMTYHFGSDIWGTVFGALAGIPRIISNRRDEGFWRSGIHVFAYKITNRWVNKIVVVSKAVKDVVMREEGIPAEKIEVIYSGIDPSRFAGKQETRLTKEALKLPKDAKVIGCVGNLRPVKGHRFLIEAARMIVKEFPQTHFLLVGGEMKGEAEFKKEIEGMLREWGLGGNIHLLGRRTDIPQLLAVMDICVLPSLSEGLSNTLLEYMAGGHPVVATRAGGNPEVISDKVNGILVDCADSKGLADQLKYLLANPEECRRLGARAKEDIEKHFTIGRMTEKYQVFLDKLLGITPAINIMVG